ncbi:MAG TPA: hypothetical protein VJ692_16810 [Nitrospiraceae bacterium]|nr:hypothetical protein [Nitrospiraceae bacterium]
MGRTRQNPYGGAGRQAERRPLGKLQTDSQTERAKASGRSGARVSRGGKTGGGVREAPKR